MTVDTAMDAIVRLFPFVALVMGTSDLVLPHRLLKRGDLELIVMTIHPEPT